MGATGHETIAVPGELVSPRAKLVYLYLASAEEATPSELTDTLDLDKLTVLSILRSLSSRGLVSKTDRAYTCNRS